MPTRDRKNRICYAAMKKSDLKEKGHCTKSSNAAKLDIEYVEKFTTCQCSYFKLKMPGMIISRMGKLYNKEDLFELLVDRTKHDPTATTDFQKTLTKKLKRIKEIRTSKDFWEVADISKNPLYVDEDNSNKKNSENDNTSYLKSLGLQTKNNIANIDNSMISTNNANEKFPFSCGMTNYVMNGTHKFVFGLSSKTIVSEKALRSW